MIARSFCTMSGLISNFGNLVRAVVSDKFLAALGPRQTMTSMLAGLTTRKTESIRVIILNCPRSVGEISASVWAQQQD